MHHVEIALPALRLRRSQFEDQRIETGIVIGVHRRDDRAVLVARPNDPHRTRTFAKHSFDRGSSVVRAVGRHDDEIDVRANDGPHDLDRLMPVGDDDIDVGPIGELR